jgi:glycosyltransferase involved in cell wall biosynthesis
MKLLYVCNETAFFMSHRLPIAKAAIARGWSITLAAQDTGEAGSLAAAGLTVIRIDVDRTGLNPIRDLRTVLQLYRIMLKLKPELIHAITIKPAIYGGAIAKWLKAPASVASICGMGQPTGLVRMLVRQMLRPSLSNPNSVTIFQNDADRIALQALCAATVTIRGSGVDLDQFYPAPRRRSQGRCIVIMPARLIASKGVREFVLAARILRSRGVDGTFALVGAAQPGNRGRIPETELNRWIAEGVVEWWGHKCDMAEVYRHADVVCLPSRGGEGVPRVLLEAAASGLPVVTTDVPGCGETVEHGTTGLVVQPWSPIDLAAALRSLIEQSELRRALGSHARRRAEALFSIDAVVDAHMKLYDSLLERARSARPRRHADGDDLSLFGR